MKDDKELFASVMELCDKAISEANPIAMLTALGIIKGIMAGRLAAYGESDTMNPSKGD